MSVTASYDILGIGNAIVDVVGAVDESFLSRHDMHKGAMALIDAAIEESLRFNTSAQRFKRTVMRETELHGRTLRTGDKVALAYGSGNRDRRKFPNPDVYDIDRRPYVLQEAVADAKARFQRAQAALHEKRTKSLAISAALVQPATIITQLPALALHHSDDQAARDELLAAQLALALAELRLQQRQQPSPDQHANILAESTERQLALAEARKTIASLEAAQWRTPVKKKAPVLEQLKQAQAQLKQAEEQSLKPLAGTGPSAKYPAATSGRRLALARWIADTRNPLTARVAVNHIWLRHFGQPLVPTVFDFGKNGQPPTHPALLDWLAAEFMDSGWSLKKLHKLIVTSNTYRLDSTPSPAALERDPDNRYYWRHAPTRMQAEVIRDSLLHLAGKLDFTQSGPDLDQEKGLTTSRRSLYYRHANEKQMTFLVSFDAPTPTECYRRVISVVPQQALALANSSIAQDASVNIAQALTTNLGPQATLTSFITAAFIQILGRSPTSEEQTLSQRFLQEQEARMAITSTKTTTPSDRAKASLILVLLNHHEFITIR